MAKNMFGESMLGFVFENSVPTVKHGGVVAALYYEDVLHKGGLLQSL